MRPSGEPGKGEALCTGMIGCSPTQRESNPSASACRATTATSTGWRVGNIMMPTFMGGLLLDGIWAQLLAGYLCDALASSLGYHDGFSHIPSHLVVECGTAHRKPLEVRICILSNQSRVGTLPPSTSTPHWPACL